MIRSFLKYIHLYSVSTRINLYSAEIAEQILYYSHSHSSIIHSLFFRVMQLNSSSNSDFSLQSQLHVMQNQQRVLNEDFSAVIVIKTWLCWWCRQQWKLGESWFCNRSDTQESVRTGKHMSTDWSSSTVSMCEASRWATWWWWWSEWYCTSDAADQDLIC